MKTCNLLFCVWMSSTLLSARAQTIGNQTFFDLGWIPDCAATQTFPDFFTCVVKYSTNGCITSTKLDALENCVLKKLNLTSTYIQDLTNQISQNSQNVDSLINTISSIIGSIYNTSKTCLDVLTTCVSSNIQARIQTLNPCLEFNLLKLHACTQANGQCQKNCTALFSQYNISNITLFGTDDSANLPQVISDNLYLTSCQSIQRNVVTPTCGILGCCPQCSEIFANLTTCLVNNVLNFTADCKFTCGANAVAASAAVNYDSKVDYSTNNACLRHCLQYSPGIGSTGVQDLNVRAPVFVPCVYNNYVHAIATVAVSDATVLNDTNTGNQKTSSAHLMGLPTKVFMSIATLSLIYIVF